MEVRMQFSKRLTRSTKVRVIKCDNLSASRVISLRTKMNRILNSKKEKNLSLILDCKSVRKTDVAGIGMLVERLIRVKERNGAVKLCQVRPEVSKVMNRVGVNSLFETYSTKEEALKSFKG